MATEHVRVEEEEEEQEVDNDFLASILGEEAARFEQESLPQIPTLTADTAAGYVTDTEQLLSKGDVITQSVNECLAYRSRFYEHLQAIIPMVYNPREQLNRNELQVKMRVMIDTMDAWDERFVNVMTNVGIMVNNYKQHNNMAMDVLLHRPSQMQLLEPTAPHYIPVTTPTLGVDCDTIDDVKNLRAFGIRLASV